MRVPTELIFRILAELRNMMGWHRFSECIEDDECRRRVAEIIEASAMNPETDKGLRYIELHENAYRDLADLLR